MIDRNLSPRLVAEALGTGLLVTTVVGSGIMAERLSGGNIALALLANTLPTGAILVVLITILAPVSGAHLNPVVTGLVALRRGIGWRDAALYIPAQIFGGLAGTILAHAMFGLDLFQVGTTARTGGALWLAEVVATAGLILTIFVGHRSRPDALPVLIGLYVVAAYWFTASTSFANPAVTIARAATGTFAGIRPSDVGLFLFGQLAGGLLGWLLSVALEPGAATSSSTKASRSLAEAGGTATSP